MVGLGERDRDWGCGVVGEACMVATGMGSGMVGVPLTIGTSCIGAANEEIVIISNTTKCMCLKLNVAHTISVLNSQYRQ